MNSLASSVQGLGEPNLSNPIGWTENSKTLTSFTYFPRLPAEMRLKIYHIELFRQRILTVEAYNGPPRRERVPAYMDIFVRKIRCDAKNPALLFVNKETRMEALRFLSKLDLEPVNVMVEHSMVVSLNLCNNRPLYANLQTDALAFTGFDEGFLGFDEGFLLKMMADHDYAGLKSVALWYDSELLTDHYFGLGELLQGLEELIILMPQGSSDMDVQTANNSLQAEYTSLPARYNSLPAMRVELQNRPNFVHHPSHSPNQV